MSNPNTLPFGASLMVVRPDGTFLAVTRRHSAELCLPGGKRDEGEDSKTNAIRETFEEAGLVINESELSSLFSAPCDTDPVSGRTFFVDTFLVSWTPGHGEPRQMEEGIEVQWITPEEFMNRTTFPVYNQGMLDAWGALKA